MTSSTVVILSVHVVRVKLDLSGLPVHAVSVSGFGE
jgi:hypothetical protein